MTLETNQSESEPPVSVPYGWNITEASFPLVVFSILLDRVITGIFYQYESNRIVTELGLFRWYALTAVAIAALGYIFYFQGMFRYRSAVILNYLIAGMHIAAVASNLAVVL